jgi:hypothetical protein
MPIEISTRFSFTLDTAADVLLQFEAAAIPEQRVLSAETRLGAAGDGVRVAARRSCRARSSAA